MALPLVRKLFFNHQGAGYHIVKSLFFFGKASHDIADAENHSGNNFTNIPNERLYKIQILPIDVAYS